MKIDIKKSLILEQMSSDVMHAALQGRTLSPDEILQEALRKQNRNISDISDASHKKEFAKTMYGKTPADMEHERERAAKMRAIGL